FLRDVVALPLFLLPSCVRRDLKPISASDSAYLPISQSTGQRLELHRYPPISQLYLRLHHLLGLPDEATTERNAASDGRRSEEIVFTRSSGSRLRSVSAIRKWETV